MLMSSAVIALASSPHTTVNLLTVAPVVPIYDSRTTKFVLADSQRQPTAYNRTKVIFTDHTSRRTTSLSLRTSMVLDHLAPFEAKS
jgi:hypothetical protein